MGVFAIRTLLMNLSKKWGSISLDGIILGKKCILLHVDILVKDIAQGLWGERDFVCIYDQSVWKINLTKKRLVISSSAVNLFAQNR